LVVSDSDQLPRSSGPVIDPPGKPAAVSLPAPELAASPSPHRHLVVVVTRRVNPDDNAGPRGVMVTRFWHPRDRRWSENFFESLDHAIRLFVDESGWRLLQQQPLKGEHEHELIFEARPEDFTGPSTEEILGSAGLTPQDVKKLLDGSDQ
jgi:hypothetical protein